MTLTRSVSKSKKRLLIAGGLIAASTMTVLSPITAIAATGTVSMLSSLFGAAGVDVSPYLAYLTEAEDFYKAIATKNLREVLSGIEVASGELGIPIPEEVLKAIDLASKKQDGQQGSFGIGATALNQVLQGQVDAKTTGAISQSLLSSEGQSRIADVKEMTAKANASSLQASQKAGESNVTQDVLKQIAIQNGDMTSLLKSIYDSNVDSQVADAVTSQAIGNISQTLTSDAWGKKVDERASQIGLMDTTSLFSALAAPATK